MQFILDLIARGIPWAALGAILQAGYIYFRNRSSDKRLAAAADLENRKFKHQARIERLRFGYEQRRWREQFATQLALKHVETRLAEYSSLWSKVQLIAKNQSSEATFTQEAARELAGVVQSWRYSTGGLLAEETTRDVAYAFQRALWRYNTTPGTYRNVRLARRILRDALRSDIGVSEAMSGKSIIDIVAERQKLKSELAGLQSELGIPSGAD